MARPKKVITANITWLGEDDLHEDGNGPRKNIWNGIEFTKGKPIEVSNPHLIEKAKGNPFYSVEGFEKEDEPPADQLKQPASSALLGTVHSTKP